jgi:hypothetical protein
MRDAYVRRDRRDVLRAADEREQSKTDERSLHRGSLLSDRAFAARSILDAVEIASGDAEFDDFPSRKL